MTPLLDQTLREAFASALPDTSLACSEWAEQYRHVSPERSRFAGKWQNERTPYLREIMDAASDPRVRRVVFMKSSQVAGSEFAVNYLMYRIHLSPTMMIYCAENEDKRNAFVNESFDTATRATPVIRERIVGKVGTEDNNLQRKKFPGGLLSCVYATSAAQLSSRPAEVVIVDEVDATVENAEGSPVALLEARTKTFNDIRKIILISSPRDRETSVIEAEYLASDQRKYHVPCPHCGEYQILEWKNVRWDDDPLAAFYVCSQGCMIEHFEKDSMLARGKWVAKEEFKESVGFAINELYSPFTTWGDMAADFVKAKKFRSTLKTFINTRLGETWEEEGEQVEFADITFHREKYEAEIPKGVLFLTAGVDVQDDRLEVEVVGWGIDHESWSIGYEIIPGDPGLADVWDSLFDYLTEERYDSKDHAYKIKSVCIDVGGHHTKQVYKFCKANRGRRWFAVKGANTYNEPIVSKPREVGRDRNRLIMVGTDTAKDEIFSFLKVAEPGSPGYCHFPEDREDFYFKQFCAEKKVTHYYMGKARKVYKKVSEKARNEALDLRVYATAARELFDPKGRYAKRKVAEAEKPSELVENISSEENILEKDIKTANINQNRPKYKRFRAKTAVNWR